MRYLGSINLIIHFVHSLRRRTRSLCFSNWDHMLKYKCKAWRSARVPCRSCKRFGDHLFDMFVKQTYLRFACRYSQLAPLDEFLDSRVRTHGRLHRLDAAGADNARTI